jgi:hypothetical protein
VAHERPTAAYPPTSRYNGVATTTITLADGRTVSYLRRRVVPQPSLFATLQSVTIQDGDRIDRVAAQYLGDPLAFWRLCDANGALQPEDLTANPGSTISIPLPAGVGTAPGG